VASLGVLKLNPILFQNLFPPFPGLFPFPDFFELPKKHKQIKKHKTAKTHIKYKDPKTESSPLLLF
jgi:hypothetical protein